MDLMRIKIFYETFYDYILPEGKIKIIYCHSTSERFDIPTVPTVTLKYKEYYWAFPGGAVVENLPANAGDTGSSPGLGRSHMPRSN